MSALPKPHYFNSEESKKLRFAIIGAGRIEYVHAGSIFDTPDTELVYIVDPFK